MSARMTREAYAQIVAEDAAWLRRQPRSLERDHILQILALAVEYEYDPPRPQDASKPTSSPSDPRYHSDGTPDKLVARWISRNYDRIVRAARGVVSDDPFDPLFTEEAPDSTDRQHRRDHADPLDVAFETCLLNGLYCIDCGEPQRQTPNGASCSNGHGGAPGVSPSERKVCVDCGERQRELDSGALSCPNGHVGAPSVTRDEYVRRAEALARICSECARVGSTKCTRHGGL